MGTLILSLYSRFLLGVGLVWGGAYAAAFAFGISPGYCAHSRSFADTAPCYKYNVRDVRADALLVGDSSLLYAIRPSLVEQGTGVSSYNYGMVGPAFSFNPEAIIDHYLATNVKPRFIVVYISPWHRLERYSISDPVWFPIALLTLRHGTWVDFLRLFRARLSAVVEIPPTILRSIQVSTAPATAWRAKMEGDGGRLDYAANLTAENRVLADHCADIVKPAANHYAADNRDEIAALRAHYAALSLPLYVYVAPTAACDGHIDRVRAAYDGVADNLPEALADKYFAYDTRTGGHSHVNAEGAAAASRLFSDFLSARGLSSRNENLKQ
jgi:hypothetical protein